VDLDIQGTTVHFEVDAANPNSVEEQATTFCTQYGPQFGVTDESLPPCITNIQQALERPIASYVASQAAAAAVAPSTPEELAPGESEVVTETETQTVELNPSQVVVSSFPLGSKNFPYRYVLGVDAAANAANFCSTFWSELEGAFAEVSNNNNNNTHDGA
jgi:hypothetical protein